MTDSIGKLGETSLDSRNDRKVRTEVIKTVKSITKLNQSDSVTVVGRRDIGRRTLLRRIHNCELSL